MSFTREEILGEFEEAEEEGLAIARAWRRGTQRFDWSYRKEIAQAIKRRARHRWIAREVAVPPPKPVAYRQPRCWIPKPDAPVAVTLEQTLEPTVEAVVCPRCGHEAEARAGVRRLFHRVPPFNGCPGRAA